MTKPVSGWDRHAINAEVRRRGMTLTGIALDAGLSESACRQGIIGYNRRGAQAIADALGLPFRELFPDSYTRGRHSERKTNLNDRSAESAKTASAADATRGAA
jgi:Ner family transcriptional regulator